jgi:uncharacterized protein (DUF342 family)
MNTLDMQNPTMESGTHISITVEEYERLNQLDENVSKRIKKLKKADLMLSELESPHSPTRSKLIYDIKLLEGLYK